MVHLTVCHYQVKYAFEGESKLYIFMNVNEFLAETKAITAI